MSKLQDFTQSFEAARTRVSDYPVRVVHADGSWTLRPSSNPRDRGRSEPCSCCTDAKCLQRKESRELDELGWCQLPKGHQGNCDADYSIPTDPALDTGCEGCE